VTTTSENHNVGKHVVILAASQLASSGVYFYRLAAGNFTASKKCSSSNDW